MPVDAVQWSGLSQGRHRSHGVGSQTVSHSPCHVVIHRDQTDGTTLKIQPRVYSKKYMRKRVYQYVRYYLEIPKRIAEPSLGIQLEARRLGEHIIIGPAGHSNSFSLIEKAVRQDDQKCADHRHVCVDSRSNSGHLRQKT